MDFDWLSGLSDVAADTFGSAVKDASEYAKGKVSGALFGSAPSLPTVAAPSYVSVIPPTSGGGATGSVQFGAAKLPVWALVAAAGGVAFLILKRRR